MASKTISVKEDTYGRLSRAKGEGESFSDVIDRLLETREGDNPLYDLVGACDEDTVDRLRTRAEAFRTSADERLGP